MRSKILPVLSIAAATTLKLCTWELTNRAWLKLSAAGVKSVPALVLDGQPFHINYGADLSALRT